MFSSVLIALVALVILVAAMWLFIRGQDREDV